MRLDVYVNYRGNCEEAFRFYEQHLGGRLTGMVRHGEQPNPAGRCLTNGERLGGRYPAWGRCEHSPPSRSLCVIVRERTPGPGNLAGRGSHRALVRVAER